MHAFRGFGLPAGSAAFALILGWSSASALAEDRLILGFGEGFPGDRGVAVMVTARHDQPIHGFSLAISYPASELQLSAISERGTQVEAINADFYHQIIDNQKGQAVLGAIFSLSLPVTSTELPPTLADDLPQLIARLNFDVKVTARPGTYPLQFADNLLQPPVSNRFTSRGTTVVPKLTNGTFMVNSDNVLTVESKFAFPGTRNTYFAFARHPQALQGYQVALAFDKRALATESATISGTSAEQLLGGIRNIEFIQINENLAFSPTMTRITAGIVFDAAAPFDDRKVLRAETSSDVAQSIMRYSIVVNGNADLFGESFELSLLDLPTPGAINNVFIANSLSVTPKLVHGRIFFSTGTLTGRVIDPITGRPVRTVKVAADPKFGEVLTDVNGVYNLPDLPPGPYSLLATKTGYFPARLPSVDVQGKNATTTAPDILIYPKPVISAGFRRGLVNDDSRLDISDVVVILGYLFQGTVAPSCLKAADANDDGRVDISDGITLLGYLFLGEEAPRPPFVDCGLDPTPDVLDCQSFPGCAF